jgi:hypothetical protein
MLITSLGQHVSLLYMACCISSMINVGRLDLHSDSIAGLPEEIE